MKTKLFYSAFSKTFCYALLLLLLLSSACFGQNNRVWATYYGGPGEEENYYVATDASGNIYLAGSTTSTSGIASGGFQNSYGGSIDAFLVKFDALGNRLWATYYGGPSMDFATSVATDLSGNVYLAGTTYSNSGIASGGFQNTFGGLIDVFLVKFDSAGNRIWATYYGGPNVDETPNLAIDGFGNIYLEGHTNDTSGIASGGFQNTLSGYYDEFLVKFNSAGNRIWATYYGGPGTESGNSVTCDALGNVYISGTTTSTSGIASGGFQNIFGGISDDFLVKFDSLGNRIWATYYGGPSMDFATSVATDLSGNVYLAGTTYSNSGIASGGFQNTFGGLIDVFLVKFDSAGNRIWATYYGGPNVDETPNLAIDGFGNIYLEGHTNDTSGIASGGFQNTLSGYYDEFLVKFNSAGNRIWATYYGGPGTESGNSVTCDALGNVYISGTTTSTSGIASGGFQNIFGGISDDFLVKFDSLGNRIWATYYGGANNEDNCCITTDASGNVYLAGITASTSGIASGGFQNILGGSWDAYLVKFNSSGNRLWATYYGGTKMEECFGITTDSSNNVYMSGDTYSHNGIATGGFQDSLIGSENQFIVKFDSTGNRLCATYYGHAFQGDCENGYIALDKFGHIYLSGSTSDTIGIASGGFQNIYGGGVTDCYLAKFTSCFSTLSATATTTQNTCRDQCIGTATVATAGGTSPYTYSWNTTPVQTTATSINLCAGNYTATVTDNAGNTATANATITAAPAMNFSLRSTAATCPTCCDACVSASVTGGCNTFTYAWSPNVANTPSFCTACAGTTYTVTVEDNCGCSIHASITPDTIAQTVGIVEQVPQTLLTFQIYNNTIIFSKPIRDLKIFDIPGRLQYNLTGSGFKQAKLPALKTGIYFITAQTQDGQVLRDKMFIGKE